MAKPRGKRRRIVETVLIVALVLCVGLVLIEVGTNLNSEVAPWTQTETIIEETPTPVPTLTDQEWRDSLSDPVGEEGNE